MSTRETLARGLAAKRHNTPWEELRPFTRACFRTLALTIERILTAAGFSIVHKDEIHAPSVERLDELESVLAEIRQWCEAYPISVFPEPDFAKVRELLAAGGITLDAVSASNMRHVVNSISKIIDAAALRELMKEVG